MRSPEPAKEKKMSEEVSIHIGVPIVRQTKLLGHYNTEVRASAKAPAFSTYYYRSQQDGPAPTVGERLLVAVLSGVHPEWLPIPHDVIQVPIGYKAVSAVSHGGNDPSRANQFDTLRFYQPGRPNLPHLEISMGDESGSVSYATVALTKEQVAQMLAALLAIYPRLNEN